jgi:cellulose synthase/poly-beta-1,6-N-acetylglucosamine synthase-like glycosyltransferase
MNAFANIILWIAYVLSLYFSIFLLLIYLDKTSSLKKEKSSVNPEKLPLISIIVPAYNEEGTILKTLKSIQNMDYPHNKLDVLVVNDGSSDKTEEITKEYIKGKFHFKLISHKNKGKAASMNKAIEIAKGEFFACLDADSFVHPFTLKKMLSLYYKENDPRLAIITPAMKVFSPSNILQKIQWLEYLVIILIARLTSQLDSLYVAPGPFSIYRTDVVRNIGGFDEQNITEDQEIAYRIQKENYRIKQCFDGYVYTNAPSKLKPFYKQRRRWYLGSISCINKYKDMIANRKYGDFGMMQMVKNVVAYFLAITGITLAIYFFIIPLIKWIKQLFVIKFNILPYLTSWKLKFSFIDILTADFKQGVIVVFLFMIGFFFFYAAHKNADEKMIGMGWIPLIPYFAFYYLLKGVILLMALFEFSGSKKIKW